MLGAHYIRMLVIRLFRTGKKNQPFFKIVVTDKTRPPRAGRFVEEVGFYNPLTKEKNIKKERVKYWLSVGAKPSDTAHNLLISEKVIEGKKIPKHKISKKKEKELAPASAPAEVPSPLPPIAEAGVPEKPTLAFAKATAGKEEKPEEKPEEKEAEKTPKEKVSEEKPVKEKPAKGKIEKKPPKEKVPKEKSPKEEAKGKEEKKLE